MLTPDEIKSIDKSSICEAYDRWAEYGKIAFDREIVLEDKLFENPSSIVFSGMGGSGTTGDILADWLKLKFALPVHVSKDYHLPMFVNKNTLVIATSVSGDTEETLAALLQANKIGAKVVAISAGGGMEEICKKRTIPHIKIEQKILPRVTLPEIIFSVLKIFSRLSLVKAIENEIEDSLYSMRETGNLVASTSPFERNPSKQLASTLMGKVPAAYSSPLQRGVGIRFKNSVNENAKINAIASELLDACHNELVSWGHDRPSIENAILHPVLIRSKFDPPEVVTRFDIFKEMLEKNGHNTNEVPLYGSTPLGNIISSLYLLDYCTIYLGILRRIDPAPITAISKFKDEMKKRLDYLSQLMKTH